MSLQFGDQDPTEFQSLLGEYRNRMVGGFEFWYRGLKEGDVKAVGELGIKKGKGNGVIQMK